MKNKFSFGLVTATLVFSGVAAWVSFKPFSDETDSPSVQIKKSASERGAPSLPIWDERNLTELSSRDPVEAIRLSQQLSNGAERERVLIAALESMKRSDPARAAEIVAGLPAGDFQQIAAGQVATVFAKMDPVAAFAWAQTLGDDRSRLRAVREVASVWAETDPQAAAASLASLGSERERQLSALAVASVWTRSDPAASLAWAETLHPLDARALVAGSAVQTWADRDAASAMDWLANQPAEFQTAVDRDTSLGIISKWTAQDPQAVREFVRTMTPGEGQARAVDAVAWQLAKHDPVGTMEWALALPQEAVRNAAFSTAYRQWRDVAPQQAEVWLKAAELTAEEKLRLVNYP